MKALPSSSKPTVVKTTGGRPKKSKNPLCIDKLLQGTPSGSRDVAAFALARYFLDQRYLGEEVLQLLQKWGENNRLLLDDPHLLLTRIRSAAKGYSFGCFSIKDDPLKRYVPDAEEFQDLVNEAIDMMVGGVTCSL